MKKIEKLILALGIIAVLAGCKNPNSPEPMKTVETPEFSVASDSVISGTSVKITCATEDAKIYYTTDGSEPTAESTEYKDAISITAAITIKAIAVKDGMNNSEVASVSYTIYNGPTYTVKFEEVETEYWLEDKSVDISLRIIDESKVKDAVLDCIKSYKPSFETKTLKENEEYVLEDYNKWIFGNEENKDLKLEVQYFADKELTSSIEPGSVIKNENKTIYVKFVWYLYFRVYTKQ